MSAAWEELDEAMSGPEPDFEQEPEAPDNAEHADWLLRRVARCDRKAEDMRYVVSLERAKLDTFEAGQLEKLHRERVWLTDALAMYHRAVLSREPRRKTIELPNGTLRARRMPLRWEFDEATFIGWATDNAPDLLRVPEPKVAVDKAQVKKALAVNEAEGYCIDSDGIRVPGVAVTVQDDDYTVEVKP